MNLTKLQVDNIFVKYSSGRTTIHLIKNIDPTQYSVLSACWDVDGCRWSNLGPRYVIDTALYFLVLEVDFNAI